MMKVSQNKLIDKSLEVITSLGNHEKSIDKVQHETPKKPPSWN